MDEVEYDNLDVILFVLLFLLMLSCMCNNVYNKTNYLIEGLQKDNKNKNNKKSNNKDDDKKEKKKNRRIADRQSQKARKKLDDDIKKAQNKAKSVSAGTIDQLNANKGGNNVRLSDEEFYKYVNKPSPQAPSPQAPSPQAPSPQAPSLQAPSPQAPSPQAPSPQAPSPQAPSKLDNDDTENNVMGFIEGRTLDDVPLDVDDFYKGLPKNRREIYCSYDMNNVYPSKDFSSFNNLRSPSEINDKVLKLPITYNKGIFDCLEEVNGFIPGASEPIEESLPQDVSGFISGATRDDDDDDNNLIHVHIVWADWCGYSNKAMESWPKMQSIMGNKHRDTKIIYKDILERDNKHLIGSGKKYDTSAFPYIFVMGNINNKPVNEKFNAVETDGMVDKLKNVIQKYYEL